MLETMRNASKGWLAALLLIVLAGSFAVWGVQDMVNLTTTPYIAKVGSHEISNDDLQREFTRFLREMERQSGTQLSTQQAKALNLDREALDRLLTRLAILEKAKDVGLKISDAQLIDTIKSIPGMSDGQGGINYGALQQVLSNSQLTQDQFLDLVRGDILREQLIRTMLAGIAIPTGLEAALNRFRLERRVIEYVILDPSKAGEIKDPDEATLRKYYEANAAQRYSVPEYRTVTIVQARPADVASQITVTEDEIKRIYDLNKREYEVPEKRSIQQMSFKTEDAARAAKAKLTAGQTFEAVAQASGLKPDDIKPAEVAKNAPGIPPEAFTLPLNTISEPLKSPFGWVILRALSSTPGSLKTLDEVRGEIRERFINERSREKLFDLTNEFEDTRGGGATLEEAAKKHSLPVTKVKFDEKGNDPEGKPVEGLPAGDFLAKVFAAERGVDAELTESGDGNYFDFRVDEVAAASKKPLDQVRTEILADWRDTELKKRLQAIADDLVKKGNAGQSLTALASSLELAPLNSDPLPRYTRTPHTILSPAVVTAAHESKVGTFFTGPVTDGKSLVVGRLANVQYADEAPDSPERAMYASRLREAYAGDLAEQLANSIREEVGVTIDEANFQKFHTGE